MKFRLVYQGPLPSASKQDSRVDEKHAIRRVLHPQLRELWRTHPQLSSIVPERVEQIGQQYNRGSFNFVPLVRDYTGFTCSIEVLFLRRDQPGGIVSNRGDLDNRIKTLFDALRIPSNLGELPKNCEPSRDEHPMHCLLDDDRLITEVKVTTDRLLIPIVDGKSHNENEVVLILSVTARHPEDIMAAWGALN